MRYTPKFILKTSLIAIVCGFIAGYTLFQSQNLMKGPVLTVFAPGSAGSGEESVEIKGQAVNIAFLTFNDRQIYTDKDGIFSERILLSEGYNVLKLKATDKFGRETEREIPLVYERPQEPSGSLSASTVNDNGKAN